MAIMSIIIVIQYNLLVWQREYVVIPNMFKSTTCVYLLVCYCELSNHYYVSVLIALNELDFT